MTPTATHSVDLALDLLKGGQAEKAIEILASLESSGGPTRDLYHVMALAAFSLGRVEDAVSHLQKELTHFPDNEPAAQLHKDIQSELERGQQHVHEASPPSQESIDEVCRQIEQTFQQGQYEACLEVTEKLIASLPGAKLQNIHLIRAECFDRSKEYFSALGELSQELGLMSSDDPKFGPLAERIRNTVKNLRFRKPLRVPQDRLRDVNRHST